MRLSADAAQVVTAIASTAIALFALLLTITSTWRSEKTAKQLSRAYISVEKVNILQFGQGQRPLIVCAIRNTGQTPAYDVRFATLGAYGDVGTEERLKPANIKGPSQSIIGPGGHSYSSTPLKMPLSAEQAARIADGQAYIGVVGVASYRDVFGARHYLEFRSIFGGAFGVNSSGDMFSDFERAN